MQFISLKFLLFFIAVLVVYYKLSNKFRTGWLLAANSIFCFFNGELVSLVCLTVSIISTFYAAILIEKNHKKVVFWSAIVINAGWLVVVKYLNFFAITGNIVAAACHMPAEIPHVSVAASVGISFYTLQMIAYLTDVYWEIIPAEHDLVAYAVFGSYFPQLLSGPISRWNELGRSLKQITENCMPGKRTECDLTLMAKGLQRILWGVFKKLVISERLAVITNEVYSSFDKYSGFAIIIATAGFAIQLYTDFSGYTDMALGISETLGIDLPNNFKCPFFAHSISEYWKRWHITLGAWFKDYVFYPLQQSGFMCKVRISAIKKWGKKAGKKIPVFISLFILWFMTGMWHGGAWKFIIGSGLLHCFYIIAGQLCEGTLNRLQLAFHLKTDVFSYRLFLKIRTFFLVCIGFVFFRAPSARIAVSMIRKAALIKHYRLGELLTLSKLLSIENLCILLASMAVLFIHDIMEEYFLQRAMEHQTVRDWFNDQNLMFRMVSYWMLVGLIALSLNLSTNEFIYMQF